jgi:hypothetical protein
MTGSDAAAYRNYAAVLEASLGWFASPAMLRLLADNHQRLALYCAIELGAWELAARYRKAAAALRERAQELEARGRAEMERRA